MAPHSNALLLALVLPAAAAAAAPPRETVSFNFGWKFSLGDPPSAPPVCGEADFESLTTDCTGVYYAPLHSADDCMKACCPGSGYHPNCTVWSWCAANDPAHWKENVTTGCYLGGADARCPGKPSQIKWSGGRRTSPRPERAVPAYAAPSFDDTSWSLVDAPHDFVIDGDFSNATATDNGQHGYLPRKEPGFYRKHFKIPADWQTEGVALWLRFHGVFHTSAAWLDGIPLKLGAGSLSGYTAFAAPLPAGLGSEKHVLTLRVDASFGSGHWYEGGGIFRDCFLVAAQKVHVAEDGLFAPTKGESVMAQVEVVNEAAATTLATARFTVWDSDGVVVASSPPDKPPGVNLYTGEAATLKLALPVPSPSSWSVHSPSLYTVGVELYCAPSAAADGASAALPVLCDALNVTTGFRTAEFTADTGFHLNGIRTPLRGFSNHNDMAGVGAAVPARLNLYRAQMLRAVGGNIWRMSHNPGDPSTFDLFDRLGIMSWDENRDYGKASKPHTIWKIHHALLSFITTLLCITIICCYTMHRKTVPLMRTKRVQVSFNLSTCATW